MMFRVSGVGSCGTTLAYIDYRFKVDGLGCKFRDLNAPSSTVSVTTLETTQGQILSRSPTDAIRFWWQFYGG